MLSLTSDLFYLLERSPRILARNLTPAFVKKSILNFISCPSSSLSYLLRAGQGQVPVTLSMLCHCGGTGTAEWGQFSSYRWRVASKHSAAKRVQDCFAP
ncbi:hypothetical protein R3W88_002514 [Solanum pinnatisectum]|uniref:Uncharacterized protein n=1 Tax=Solanum pinnatisectum TaxID=50273 RepID=A0AAV9MLF4_9SOLN|nr:hypothetical protein R3W88_002514 [Solanum pinnatisectum]